jgi:hypothetical protein
LLGLVILSVGHSAGLYYVALAAVAVCNTGRACERIFVAAWMSKMLCCDYCCAATAASAVTAATDTAAAGTEIAAITATIAAITATTAAAAAARRM